MSEEKIGRKEAGKAAVSLRAELFQKVLAFIPEQINNKTVIGAFELMRRQQKLKSNQFHHLESNAKQFEGHQKVIDKNKGYIEDQCTYGDMHYGKSTIQAAGCEIIATYNALVNIHGFPRFDLSELISFYEKDGMVLDGRFGTAPRAMADLLDAEGYETHMEIEDSRFDEMGKKFESFILTMYNDAQDISQEVHTINISKENGKFTAHNAYCNGLTVGPYATLSETIANINKGKVKGISLIGITPKPKALKAAEQTLASRKLAQQSAPKQGTTPRPAVKPVVKPTVNQAAKPIAKTTAKPTVKKN